MTNNSIIREERPRSTMPVVSRLQNTDLSRRDNEERHSRVVVPSFVAAFTGDEVTISSKKRPRDNSQGEVLSAEALVPEITREISQLRGLSPDAAASIPGVSLSSETVRDVRSFGPSEIKVNRYAVKRYDEASSFRVWHTSTFEVTA